MVDLRFEVDRIFDEYGSYALLLRNDKKVPCRCVDRLSQAPSDKCQICLGTGYINKAERVRMRSKATSSSDTLPKVVSFTELGNIGVALRQFYLDHTVRPKRQDLLILCEWDGLKPVLDEYTEIYEINNAEPMRGNGGRIEFFQVVAKSDPVNMELRFQNLQHNAGQLTYYITAR